MCGVQALSSHIVIHAHTYASTIVNLSKLFHCSLVLSLADMSICLFLLLSAPDGHRFLI